jgi:deoxycytidine triphosphate deaminase|tara:strand:- start:42726 stop:43166 length:441 start_codon:yes stop_codon:yes gene_type:complete
MLVDPTALVNGADEGTSYSVPISAKTIKGYQGNPFVINDDQELARETYELQTMIDPGDPDKEREIYHMFPGTYEFTSDVYANIPEGHVGMMIVNKQLQAGGCSIPTTMLEPGFKGLISGQLIANGGECFFQPGTNVADLIVMKVES